jgi:hypothetical protein
LVGEETRWRRSAWGGFTDKVAAALLDADLFSILVLDADGGLGGTYFAKTMPDAV